MGRRPRHTPVITQSDVGGVIHVANIKGGVGKSTVATNLAAALARRAKTLLIDLDVQGSATVALGIETNRFGYSSWTLLSKRFAPRGMAPTAGAPASAAAGRGAIDRATRALTRAASGARNAVLGEGNVASCAVRIDDNLDLVPASTELYRAVNAGHLATLRYNLELCRLSYKYIVIDTPSVWNDLSRMLYRASDLNLVPVTLNALSTRSLRDYLQHVRALAQRHRSVRVRILKNEVFGKAG